MSENRMTGLEIKQAADFQLKIRLGSGEWDIVADNKTVTVNKKQRVPRSHA